MINLLKRYGGELALCVAVITLFFYEFWSKTLWNDELYSLYSALNFTFSMESEPHSPVYFGVVRLFIEAFGIFSPNVSLLSVLPSLLALGMLHQIGVRLSGRWMGFCLVAVLALNPIFLQFARSLRGNSFLYLMPIMMWWGLVFLDQKKYQNLYLYLIVFISSSFHPMNIAVSFVVCFLYQARKNIWLTNTLASLTAVLILLVKYFVYMDFWPSSYTLPWSLATFWNFYQYLNFYADESFSIIWNHDFIKYQETVFYLPVAYLALALFFGHRNKKIFRVQLVFLGFTLLAFGGVWLVGSFNNFLLLPRNHLYLSLTFLVTIGLGMGAIKNKIVRGMVASVFVLTSLYHLHQIRFYTNPSQEVAAIKQAEVIVSQNGHLVACSFPEKFELVLASETSWSLGCQENQIEKLSHEYSKLVIMREFFNENSLSAVKYLKDKGWHSERRGKNYSEFFILSKDSKSF